MTDNILLPITFYIGDNYIDTGLLGGFFFILIFLASFYIKLHKIVDPHQIFDFAFKTIFIMLFIARLLAIVNNPNYYLTDLSQVFNFQDSKFFYPGLLLGLIISVFFVSNPLSKSTGYMNLLDISVKSYVYSSLALLIGFFLSARSLGIVFEGSIGVAYMDGSVRFPYGLIQIIYTLIGALLITIWRSKGLKSGILAAVFIMLFSTVEFILRFFANAYDPIILGFIDLYQFLYLVLLTFSILVFLRINQLQRLDEPEIDATGNQTYARAKFDILGYKKEKVSAKELFSMSYGSAINRSDIKDTSRTSR